MQGLSGSTALFLLVLALALTGCQTSEPPLDATRSGPDLIDPATPPTPVENPEDIVSSTGTITYVDLEGGFYGLIDQDGTRYLPLNLEEDFQQDGLTIRFRGRVQRDVMTIQQWGTPLELMEMLPMGDDGRD